MRSLHFLAAAAVMIAAVIGSVVAVAAAAEQNQQNDDPTAVIAAKTGIAHIGTSHELLTAETVTPHTMHNTKSGS